ncbi:hypothetical protein SAMD00019534_121450, partial [Acytostelium subglobosum LB1]|uniref:hypothetical protein n=1 Tax=Acytostelium subglobosum LB1 TaxID=1410327 RepID=UPI00064487CB
ITMSRKGSGRKKEIYVEDETLSPASYDFWEEFYETGEGSGDTYEWYVTYQHIRERLLKRINDEDLLLHVGCGNSLLAEELLLDMPEHRLLDTSILNIDVCNNAIERMITRQDRSGNTRIKHCLQYQVMDATDTKLPDHHFDGIIDKGTVDALLSTLDVEIGENEMVKRLLREMYRVLKPGGFMMCVSRNTCAEPYFYMDEDTEWQLTTEQLNVTSTKGKGIQQINYVYFATKPSSSTSSS